MKNPLVVSKLHFCVKKSMILPSANNGAQQVRSKPETVSGSRPEREHQPESVSKAIQAIRKLSSGKIYSRTLYLLDAKSAKQFASMIMTRRSPNPSYVAEINSGLGLLSRELLKLGINKLHMFEKSQDFLSNLDSVLSEYPDRACLERINFLHMWTLGHVDSTEQINRMEVYLKGLEKRSWTEEPTMEMIGAIENVDFVYRLLGTVVFQTTFAKYGRMVLFTAMPPSVWSYITCKNEDYSIYRARVVLFQSLFNYEILGTLPRDAFYPYRKQMFKSTDYMSTKRKISLNDKKFMNVVRIEPRANIFEDGFTEIDLMPYYYFVTHHMKARTNRVIPELEKWIPGCGRALIDDGLNIFTEFGELTPYQILNLFIRFKSLPGYKTSPFLSCMDSILERIDENVVFETNTDFDELFEFCADPRAKGNKELTKNPEIQELHETDMKEKL